MLTFCPVHVHIGEQVNHITKSTFIRIRTCIFFFAEHLSMFCFRPQNRHHLPQVHCNAFQNQYLHYFFQSYPFLLVQSLFTHKNTHYSIPHFLQKVNLLTKNSIFPPYLSRKNYRQRKRRFRRTALLFYFSCKVNRSKITNFSFVKVLHFPFIYDIINYTSSEKNSKRRF